MAVEEKFEIRKVYSMNSSRREFLQASAVAVAVAPLRSLEAKVRSISISTFDYKNPILGTRVRDCQSFETTGSIT